MQPDLSFTRIYTLSIMLVKLFDTKRYFALIALTCNDMGEHLHLLKYYLQFKLLK